MEDDPVLQRIDSLKSIIRKTSPEDLQERVYVCVANGCILLTAYKRAKGVKGWSENLHDEFNQPMLTSQQQKQIEDAFSKAPWILEMLDADLDKEVAAEQKGGFKIPSLKVPGSQLIQRAEGFQLTGQDVSLDLLFEKFLKKSDEVDEFWGKFAYESPGFAKLLNSEIPIPFTKISIAANPIVTFLVMIVDSIRLSYSLAGQKSQVLTLLVLVEELLTGQWRQMLMTATGFISPTGVAVGVLFKYIINAWTLINPDLRSQILKDAYRGTKSLFLGILLWFAVNLAPGVLRQQMDAALQTLRQRISEFDEKIEEVERSSSEALASQGKKVEIKGLNLDTLKNINLHDIQNLQALATWDLLVCSSDFQEIVVPLESNPVFRLILELLNVPTTPDDKLKMCGPAPYEGLVEKAGKAIEPVVSDTEEEIKKKEVEEEKQAEEEKEVEESEESEEQVQEMNKSNLEQKVKGVKFSELNAVKNRFLNKKGGALRLRRSTKFRKATPRRATRVKRKSS